MTPTQARHERRRRLVSLIHRASTELAHLEAAETRATTLRPTTPDDDDTPLTGPLSTDPGPTIRAWAKTQGIPVGDRGAIPMHVRIAYTRHHQATP